MFEFLASLSTEQASMLAGILASVIMYGVRLLPNDWFNRIVDEGKKKFRGTVVAFLTTILTTVPPALAGGDFSITKLISMVVYAFVTSQGAHNIAKRVSTRNQ